MMDVEVLEGAYERKKKRENSLIPTIGKVRIACLGRDSSARDASKIRAKLDL